MLDSDIPRRKTSRRSSTQYYIAEEHVDNEVKHERRLTETSRLSSSWANLSVSGAESECSSSNSAHTSPTHRPNSFSGPLVISVTCSSSSSCSATPNFCSLQLNNGRTTPTSPNPTSVFSGHASPVASPISSRVQCYSPGLLSSPNHRRSTPGNASPLLLSTTLSRKRGYFSTLLSSGCSSDDASREGSPDPQPFRGSKLMRHSDCRLPLSSGDAPIPLRWPPGPVQLSNPPSPSCHLFPLAASCNGTTTPSSPSTSSLSSPRLSVASGPPTFPGSPVYLTISNSLPLTDDNKLDSKASSSFSNAANPSNADDNMSPILAHVMDTEPTPTSQNSSEIPTQDGDQFKFP